MEERGDTHMEQLLERARHLENEAGALLEEARQAARAARDSLDLDGKLERHPYAMLAGALGIGYLLGGGLFTRMTSRVLRIGARLLVLPVLGAYASAEAR